MSNKIKDQITIAENFTRQDSVNGIFMDLPVRKIIRCYLDGESINALSKTFNVSRNVIDKRLKMSGIILRTQSEAESVKWANMTTSQRLNQVRSAHDATRGKPIPIEAIIKRAKTLEINPINVSIKEIRFRQMLYERGIHTVAQKAVGPYNIDLATHNIAIEIYGGNWHWYGRHLARIEKRFRYILNAGWFIYVLPINRDFPLTEAVADHCVTFINRIRRNKPSICQYFVVWGAGKYSVSGSLNDNKISIKRPFRSVRDSSTGRYKSIPR